jgi:hypothetical protein
MQEGWAWYSQAIEFDGWLAFCGVKRASKGYIAQEMDRLMEQVKNGR